MGKIKAEESVEDREGKRISRRREPGIRAQGERTSNAVGMGSEGLIVMETGWVHSSWC